MPAAVMSESMVTWALISSRVEEVFYNVVELTLRLFVLVRHHLCRFLHLGKDVNREGGQNGYDDKEFRRYLRPHRNNSEASSI